MGTSENKLSFDLLKTKVTTRLMYFKTNWSTLVGSLCTQSDKSLEIERDGAYALVTG